ncbi:MAG: phospho-N-acetylmuramoyl-pentapeptide-transferase [Phycisphaerales bacterium]
MLYNLTDEWQSWLEEHNLGPIISVMHQLQFRALFALLLAFVLVLLAGRSVISWLRRLKIGDNPEFHNANLNELMKQKKGTPTMGGLLICGAVLVTCLLLADVVHNRYVHVTLVVLVWLSILGGWDDWLKLTASRRQPGSRDGLVAWEKLLFQLGIGVIAAWFLWSAASTPDALALNLPFQRTYPPSPGERIWQGLPLEPGVLVLGLPAFLAIGSLFIAYTSNAVNISDGMDGLAAGMMTVVSIALMALTWVAGTRDAAYFLLVPYVPGSGELMVVAGALAGASLGFLWFNGAPASVFMGDTGSLAVGGVLATIAVAIRQEILLLVVGGVFYLEAVSVMAQVGFFKLTRKMTGEGRRLLRCAPIHHHFQLGGWTETQVVARFWIITAVLAMLALASVKVR